MGLRIFVPVEGMGKHFVRFLLLFMIITVGTGSWVHALVHADGGINVPEINEDFNQFEQKNPVQKEQPVSSPPVEEKKGFVDKFTESLSKAGDWLGDKISGAWEWTKEKAAAFWNWFTEICSKMAEVVIDALSAAWDWILEHKVAVLIVLTIIGIVASVIGIILGSTLAGFIGAGIIFGELINGIVSWVFLGNEFFSDEMLTDMLIGGIAGLISSFFGLIAGAGVANTSFVSWLSTRIPWLGRAFPKMFGGGIAGGVDQSLWDLLKEGKVNWKKAAVATGLGFLLVFGGEAIHSNSNKIINWINNRNISYATEIFADGTASAPKTVGDTKFGQWLQKFASNSNNRNVNLSSVPSVRNGEFNRWFNSLTPEEFDQVWSNPRLRKTIERRLRHPGGLHEWLLVSRTPTFKRWGVTAEQIKELRSPISEVRFVNPRGQHGKRGSTTAHNELIEIIDTSPDFDTFKRRLQNWANYRLEGGAEALPEGLRP
jgi:hypothetical protein